jgi:hypothetical protein
MWVVPTGDLEIDLDDPKIVEFLRQGELKPYLIKKSALLQFRGSNDFFSV